MLLGVDQEEDLTIEPLFGQRILAGVAVAALLASLIVAIVGVAKYGLTGAHSTEAPLTTTETNVAQLGHSIFTTWIFPFEITAGLLTIAVIGAVVMSRRPGSYEPLPEPEPMTDRVDGEDELVDSDEATS
jgi:NADH-quinone oxidoreductase subunit J